MVKGIASEVRSGVIFQSGVAEDPSRSSGIKERDGPELSARTGSSIPGKIGLSIAIRKTALKPNGPFPKPTSNYPILTTVLA